MSAARVCVCSEFVSFCKKKYSVFLERCIFHGKPPSQQPELVLGNTDKISIFIFSYISASQYQITFFLRSKVYKHVIPMKELQFHKPLKDFVESKHHGINPSPPHSLKNPSVQLTFSCKRHSTVL